MFKKLNLLGVIVGILVIAFSVVVFCYDPEMYIPSMTEIVYDEIGEPSYESNKSYGGDAYTGIQQASAQAANNLVAVYDAVVQNNNAIQIFNRNLKTAANSDMCNAEQIVLAMQYFFGFLLLSVGLLTLAKSVVIEITFPKKKTAEADVSVQENVVAETESAEMQSIDETPETITAEE